MGHAEVLVPDSFSVRSRLTVAPTAETGTVDGTNLVAMESHNSLLLLVEFGGLDSREKGLSQPHTRMTVLFARILSRSPPDSAILPVIRAVVDVALIDQLDSAKPEVLRAQAVLYRLHVDSSSSWFFRALGR